MSLGINALRRQICVLTRNPFLLASRRRLSLISTTYRLLSSSSAASPVSCQQGPYETQRARSPLVLGSTQQLGDALRGLNRTEAELLATLDEYEQSAEQDVSPARLSGGLDDGYPLKNLSKVKPYRIYHEANSPLITPFRRYPSRNETKASAQRHRKDLYSHIWGETHFFNGDWEKTYANLTTFTPYPSEWYSRAIEIYLTPDQVSTFFLPDPGNSIWEIGLRTGAVLELEAQDDGRQHSLVVSGEESHLRKCLDEIVGLVGEVRAKKLVPGEIFVAPERSQQYPTEFLRRKRGYLKTRTTETVDEFELPSPLTRRSLEEHVGRIVTIVPSIEAQAKYVQHWEEHQNSVVRKLMDLLDGGPKSVPREVLTTSTYKLALNFMAQKGTVFYKQLWSLFRAMPHLRVPYDVEVFNIMFENCAKSRNLSRFNTTLLVMHRLGFEPDLLTWQMFLRMVKAPVVKRKIVHDIRTRGLLRNPDDKANISMEMVGHDLEHFIRSHPRTANFNLAEFIAQQDAEYGDNRWLGLNTFKRIVGILGRFGLFKDCFRSILYLARTSSDRRPSADAFNHILLHIYRQPSKLNVTFPKLAIKTVRAMEEVRKSFEGEGKIGAKSLYKPNSDTFHLLFHLAYRLQLPNFMAVVWRYAVMFDLTTNWMRLKVTRYLVFGRLGKKSTAPVLLRSYVRRLFMDEVLMRSLDRNLIRYLRMRRRREILDLARLRGESAIRYIDLPKGEEHVKPDTLDKDSTEALITKSNAPESAREPTPKPPEPTLAEAAPANVPRSDNPSPKSRLGVDPPEAWHGNVSEFSLLSLWRSEAKLARGFDYDVWYRHGLAVAGEYYNEFRDWTPKWELSKALTYALERDLRFRACLRDWEAVAREVQRGRHRNGISHAMWLQKARRKLPAPLRIPVYCVKLDRLGYSHRFRSFGGDSSDVMTLHVGPNAKRAMEEAKKQALAARRQMKPYVKPEEFARLFSHVKSPEGKELGGWENLIIGHGHNVG